MTHFTPSQELLCICTCCGAEAPALWLHDGKTGMGGSEDGNEQTDPCLRGLGKGAAAELFLNVAQRLGTPMYERTPPHFPRSGISLTRRQGRCSSGNLLMWEL